EASRRDPIDCRRVLGGGGNTVTNIFATQNFGASQGHPPAAATAYGDGILVQASSNNSIIGNVTDNNGPFSGIGVIQGDSDHPGFQPGPANSHLVQGNRFINNAAGGVSVARRPPTAGGFPATNPNGRNNVLIRNITSGNGLFDLWDSNPACDNNFWSGDSGQKASPPCTLNP